MNPLCVHCLTEIRQNHNYLMTGSFEQPERITLSEVLDLIRKGEIPFLSTWDKLSFKESFSLVAPFMIDGTSSCLNHAMQH